MDRETLYRKLDKVEEYLRVCQDSLKKVRISLEESPLRFSKYDKVDK